jgi:hypothetical protein
MRLHDHNVGYYEREQDFLTWACIVCGASFGCSLGWADGWRALVLVFPKENIEVLNLTICCISLSIPLCAAFSFPTLFFLHVEAIVACVWYQLNVDGGLVDCTPQDS